MSRRNSRRTYKNHHDRDDYYHYDHHHKDYHHRYRRNNDEYHNNNNDNQHNNNTIERYIAKKRRNSELDRGEKDEFKDPEQKRKKTARIHLPVDLTIDQHLNPQVIVKEYPVVYGDEIKILKVIRDDKLIGGTKQRALHKMIQQHKEVEFVYAGPASGYAQLALAYCCELLGRKAVLFLQYDSRDPTPITNRARYYGAKANLYTESLAQVQDHARDYVLRSNKEHAEPYTFLCPFGLDCEEFSNILFDQLKVAIPSSIAPKRLWITVGSGTLLRVLGKIWPETTFMPVQVGKKMWEDQYEPQLWKRMGGMERIQQLKAPQHFFEAVPRNLLPPYPSLNTYDAKLWQKILKYGEDGDYIWNVGKTITDF